MVLVLGTVLLQACGPDHPERPTAKYVALGDSYSAGEGLGPFFTDTQREDASGGGHQGCHRAPASYPVLVDFQLNHHRRNRTYEHSGGSSEFLDVSCSGAVVDDLNHEGAGNQQYDTPVDRAQLDALSDQTIYVTLTLGGNDAGFGDLIETCLVLTKSVRGKLVAKNLTSAVSKHSWQKAVVQSPAACDNAIRTQRSSLAVIHNHLETIYADILKRAPNAVVVVATYPQIFPDRFRGSSIAGVTMCKVSGSTQLGLPSLFGDNERSLLAYQADLNSQIADAVRSVATTTGGTRLRLADTNASWAGHTISCGDAHAASYINAALLQVTPRFPFVNRSTASFHPKKSGQQLMARTILAVLTRGS
jgi:lysophospholipase L1-like esterase